jgi:soluble lytic murein transglycosylase-like protein
VREAAARQAAAREAAARDAAARRSSRTRRVVSLALAFVCVVTLFVWAAGSRPTHPVATPTQFLVDGEHAVGSPGDAPPPANRSSPPRQPFVAQRIVLVQPGDSFASIARTFGVTIADIVRWNHIKVGRQLKVGEALMIYPPQGAATSYNPSVGPADGAPAQRADTTGDRPLSQHSASTSQHAAPPTDATRRDLSDAAEMARSRQPASAAGALRGNAPPAPEEGRLYSYKDEVGVWHFTSIPTQGYAPVGSKAKTAVHNARAYDDHIRASAGKYGLAPPLIKAVIAAGSGFNPAAVSSTGAVGLMQLTPDAAREMHLVDVFDPAQNIDGGARYLRLLLDRSGSDLERALAAYCAGLQPTDDDLRTQTTRACVENVLRLYVVYLRER